MKHYLVKPEIVNTCSICNEHDILDWKKHYENKHTALLVYHINYQMLEAIKKWGKV